MKLFVISLFLPLIIGASSCTTGIKFDPDWHVGDYQNVAIVNEQGQFVFADESNFNNYACMSEQKVKELVTILSRARIPKQDLIRINKMLLPDFRK